MAEEGKVLHQQEFIEGLLNPEYIQSIYDPLEATGNLSISIYESVDSPPREDVLKGITPFMTLNDIKLAIYDLINVNPDYIFIGISSFIKNRFSTFEYGWSDPLNPEKSFVLASPIDLIKSGKPDTRFIEGSGVRRILRRQERDRMTFESSFLKGGKAPPHLHVYLYNVLEAAIPGERPLGEHSWNGYLYPYFPNLSVDSVKPADKTFDTRLRGFRYKRDFYKKLQTILEPSASTSLFPLTLTGIRFLRIHYIKPVAISGIESIFYNAPVNNVRPYMRLLPVEGTPISKLHMIDDKPNIEDPRLLLQWGQERIITPDRDSAFVKILLRKRSGTISPLYCTLRLLDDGTADITIEPPKGVRKLDPRSELDNLSKTIQSALEGFPYLDQVPKLSNGMFIFGLNLKGVATPLTTASLREKLPIFSSIFQEIPALPGETPLLMLRYKLISNFTNEDRIQSFITQIMNRKLLHGDTNYSDIVTLVAEDFDIDESVARKYVADRLRGANDVRPTLLADGDPYSIQSNPGIDIGIFAQHPFYSFHLYRVESSETLERIITFLSVLFSCPAESLNVPKAAVKDVVLSEKHEEDAFENVNGENAFENVDEEDVFENVDGENAFENVDAEKAPENVNGDERFEDLMFDAAEGATLEEEFANANAANFPAAEGDGAGPLETHEEVDENDEEADETARLEMTRKQFRDDFEPPATTAKLLPPAKAAPVPVTASVAASASVTSAASSAAKGFEKYFSDKLKDADRKLFDFHKTHPALSNYVTQCQSNLMRQPAVLTGDQFEQMVKEYDDVLKSKEISFFVFPLSKDAKKEPYNPGTKEYYTLMKYGTSDRNENYYLCCKYFCTRDNLLVREAELRGTKLRRPVPLADGTFRTTKRGEDKASGFLGTCPFCEGEVIKNRRFPGVNETIIERNIKAGTVDKRHEYIRFLKKTNHPDGFYLPCCFIEDQPVRVGDPAFPEATSRRAPTIGSMIKEEENSESETESSTTTLVPKKQVIHYEEVMFAAHTAYIVGSEKLPLEGIVKKYKKIRQGGKDVRGPPKLSDPQIGLLVPELNSYFSQDSIELVSRTFNPQKLKSGAQGFLRIGVENSSRSMNDSFLSAVAPFFGRNSAASMKALLEDIIQPNIFTALNYGNLLLEMHKPKGNIPAAERPPVDDNLKGWAKTMLNVPKIKTNNEELIIRTYTSYTNFINWLKSDETAKEPRHFVNLFAQPGILETGLGRIAETGQPLEPGKRPGIIFIVLDLLKNGEVKVRCPQYPMNSELYSKSDIGFLFHHYSGIWEPIFHVDNRAPAERTFNSYSLVFSNSHISKWPKIVQDRVKEFTNQCKSVTGGKGFYTSFSGISSKKCVGITALKQRLAPLKVYGTIRDSYNHIAAVVYKTENDTLVPVPAVDDGLSSLILEGVLILDWDDFTPAPIDQIVAFYTKYIYPHYIEQYKITTQIKSLGSQKIEAAQLQNGIYIPISPAAEGFNVGLPVEDVAEMEWSINRKIIMGEEVVTPLPGGEEQIKAKQMTEIYEHLRLTFSNWLHTQADGGTIRNVLEETIYRHDIPLFEKRKRLEILLSSTLESWIAEDNEDAEQSASLLRVDCTLRPKDECNGQCKWASTDKCLIHVPTSDSEKASASYILLQRLIEELLRFGGKRKQLFDQKVSQLAILDGPIRKGDQYIIPEKSSVWTDLLRLEWSQINSAAPVYLEEMSSIIPSNPVDHAISHLPGSLKTLLGAEDPLTSLLFLYPSATHTILPFLTLLNVSPSDVKIDEMAKEMNDVDVSNLLRKIKMPVVQIDLRLDPPTIIAKQPQKDLVQGYPIFVLRNDYPISLLVRDPENPMILAAPEIPVALSQIIKGSTKIFIKIGA
jgi:hypothetical protein